MTVGPISTMMNKTFLFPQLVRRKLASVLLVGQEKHIMLEALGTQTGLLGLVLPRAAEKIWTTPSSGTGQLYSDRGDKI